MPPVKARHIFPVLLCPLLFYLASCAPQAARPVYFLSDRHGLSFEVLQDWCGRTGCSTLVLFDRHNDVNADSPVVHSYDWVGQLIDRGIIDEVWWVCGYSADALELAARRRWLEANTERKDGGSARRVLEAFHITDFVGLQEVQLQKPSAVTVDLDLYDAAGSTEGGYLGETDGGPLRFIRETCAFLQKERCPLVTVSLSAAYQQSPAAAWKYLEWFMEHAAADADWFFRSGDFGEREESREELAAFARWKDDIAAFQGWQCGFYRGAYLWLGAPPVVQELFVQKKVAAYTAAGKSGGSADTVTETVLEAMRDRLAIGEALAPYSGREELTELRRIALAALEASFDGRTPAPPAARCAFDDKRSRGIAVRYRNAEKDRGCLALYFGLDFTRDDAAAAAAYCSAGAARDPRYPYIRSEELDGLFINISVFGAWEPMADWDDFIPGLDSLLLVNPEAELPGHRETLLQASLALERGDTKEAFLRRLSLKAGLGADGYRAPPLRFYKAKTLSYTAKAVD